MGMAESWQKKEVRQIGEVVTGTTPSTKKPEYYGVDYKLISPADLDNGKYVTTAHRMLSELGLEQCRVLHKNVVLVGCIGNVGKIGMVADEKAATNQQINAVICNSESDPHFIYYSLLYNRRLLEKAAVKTTVPILNKSNFEKFELDVPLFPEQRHIAYVLSMVQTAIEQQERLIKLTRELKSALMRKLFTEGLRGEKQKMTEIGSIPESWQTIKLGDLVNIRTGKLDSNAATPSGQYPFFTCSPVTARIDTFAFDTEAILLAGNNARGIYTVKHYKGKFNAYQRTYVMTQKDDSQMPYSFLLYALTTNLEHLRTVSIGTSTKYLTLGVLQNLLIIKPAYEEAEYIGNALALIDNKIVMLKQKQKIIEELFRTLLNQLMTGQTRVNDIDLSDFHKG